MAKRQTVPVSTKALVQRINRKLAARGEQMRKSRGWRTQSALGDYYIVDVTKNVVVNHHLADPETIAREEGALRPWESWAAD